MKITCPKKLEYIVILDHVEGSRTLELQAICGEVILEDDEKLVLRNWMNVNEVHTTKYDHNEKYWAIIKSTIKKRFKLEPRQR